MSTTDEFAAAQQRVNTLTAKPETSELLDLYALFKQGSLGDVTGKRPGMMDFKGRAKYDAWAARKGLTKAQAMDEYVALVDRLVGKYGTR